MIDSSQISLRLDKVSKKFNYRKIFENVSFELHAGGSIAITGKNGSGKSTLVKIISGLLAKTSGNITLNINGDNVKPEAMYKQIGFVSPYLNLYDEFTGYENLRICSEIRGISPDGINEVLKRVGLYERRNDLLKIYSSGMKQRLKLAFGILHRPDLLILDEPTSNLDTEGVGIVDSIAEEYKKDRMLIIATNDEHERDLCSKSYNIDRSKP
ncbi:MAG TPA: ABC transporter ATP-binding protein [Ignavibacteria bacterium]